MSAEVIRTDHFVADSANLIQKIAHTSLRERGQFRIALSGGNTPRPIYAEWARRSNTFPWRQVLITFGDERCVPPDDEQSNYRMARECLLQPANVPAESVMRMRGEIEPHLAAQQYQDDVDLLASSRGEEI